MTEEDRNEINALVTKYCQREADTVLAHTLGTGRLNKRALARSGIRPAALESILTKLRTVLKDDDNGR